jgi:hypothetical protein
MRWQPLAINGASIATWTGNETTDFSAEPNAGVDASCTSSAGTLIGAAFNCNG